MPDIVFAGQAQIPADDDLYSADAPLDFTFTVGGLEGLKPKAWVLAMNGVRVESGLGLPPSTINVRTTDALVRDPIFQIVVGVGQNDFGRSITVALPDEYRRRLAKRPIARLSVTPKAGGARNEVQINADGSASAVTRGGTITRWELSFGDGQNAKGDGVPPKALDHSYANNTNERLVFVASLTVFAAATDGKGELASLPATQLVNVDSLADQSGRRSGSLRLIRSDGKGGAVFGAAEKSEIPAEPKSWTLTIGGEVVKKGEGAVPAELAHTFAPASAQRNVDVVLEILLGDGSTTTLTLTVTVVPTGTPANTPAVTSSPEPAPSRKNDDEGDGL